jgi:hypothetical protein
MELPEQCGKSGLFKEHTMKDAFEVDPYDMNARAQRHTLKPFCYVLPDQHYVRMAAFEAQLWKKIQKICDPTPAVRTKRVYTDSHDSSLQKTRSIARVNVPA